MTRLEPVENRAGRPVIRAVLTLALACCCLANSLAQPPASAAKNSKGESQAHAAAAETVALPKSVPDPLESVNRIAWGFNRGVLVGVAKPAAKVYRSLVPKFIRDWIANFSRNAAYPVRLLNNLLQAKWNGARQETDRFFCNTVIGAGGLVDVAAKWNMPKSEAHFGQTFARWGWKPGCYLMLPIFGPSNERDALGLAADTAANPMTYLAPYAFGSGDPLSFFSPYSYYSYAVLFNNITDTVDEDVRFIRAETDPYAVLQYGRTFLRDDRAPDFQLKGEQDEASLETIQSALFTFQDPQFPGRGKTRSVLIPATGRNLKFTFWLQPGTAPMVYIIPGLGSHRLSSSAIAMAELLYGKGFSAVCLSSVFNPEFMEHASTAAMPAYSPVDVQDLRVALTQIDHRLQTQFPGRLGAKALMGYSLGGFHSLFIAAVAATNQASLIHFDRYVAIDAPVRLLHGVTQLDEFFQAPLALPSGERTATLENTFLKVAALRNVSPTPGASLPFNAIESRFLIGMAFRFTLRDVIFSSQRRTNQGVLRQPIRNLKRDPVYQEILQYSYNDYLDKFVVPYYQTRGVDLTAPEALQRASDLRTYAGGLQTNQDIRLIVNRNDVLLGPPDLQWLEATFEPERLTVFEKGGHLGNLSNPDVQKAILGALDGLRPPDNVGSGGAANKQEEPSLASRNLPPSSTRAPTRAR